MDPILENKEPFSGDENTSEEQRKAKKKFRFLGRVSQTKEEEENMQEETKKVDQEEDDDAFLANLQDGLKKVAVEPEKEVLKTHNEHRDPFTCYVQHVVAVTVFGRNLPKDPPEWGVDSTELFVDKTFYHRAVLGAEQFKKETHEPLIERVTEQIKLLFAKSDIMKEVHKMLVDCPELVITTEFQEGDEHSPRQSAWSNQLMNPGFYWQLMLSKDKKREQTRTFYFEPEIASRLCGIHMVYHLWRYINISYTQLHQATEVLDMNFMGVWEYLVSDDLADTPVHEWTTPFFDEFAEKTHKIFKAYEAIDKWSKE